MKPPIEAVYRDGALRPVRKIDLSEGGRYLVTIEPVEAAPGSRGDGGLDAADALLRLVGCLKGSGMCALDPLEQQRRLRDEWS